jgi:hypothetical protein
MIFAVREYNRDDISNERSFAQLFSHASKRQQGEQGAIRFSL